MKASRALSIAGIGFMLLYFPATALTKAEYRTDMLDAAQKELVPIAAKELPAESLGEWKDIIDSSLFLLLRKTELYRGPIRVLVIDDSEVKVRLYPEGTFVISSGLLDYIDQSLFEATTESPRRIRNFDSERESMLVPFLAPEIAHFALAHQFNAWTRSEEKNMIPSQQENLEADSFSVILMSLAGLDSDVMEESIATLARKIENGTLGPNFAAYRAQLPAPENRIAALGFSQKNTERDAKDFGIVLDALRRGISFREAHDSLGTLAQKYPGSPYIARLSALVAHIRWMETVSVQEQAVPTLFPFAAETSDGRPGFIALAAGSPDGRINALKNASPIPGNSALFSEAETAYQDAIAMLDEPGLLSSYATLLERSGKENAVLSALNLASIAANREEGSRSFVARANYANLLYLSGSDYAKAQTLIESLAVKQSQKQPVDTRYLDTGIPGDSRDIALSRAIMQHALARDNQAGVLTDEVRILFQSSRDTGSIDLRHLHVGDSADVLVEKWGRPALIVYNYPTEIWIYPGLSASVVIDKKVSNVRIYAHSPLSPGNDIRTGDKRSDFEAAFGKPAYRAGDCDVYLINGNRISVLYLADRIRTMTVGL